MRVEEIVGDGHLNKVWGNANFGSISRRELVAFSLLKCACGYYTGFTARQILIELELVNEKEWTLTKKGKEYLWAAFSNSLSI